MINEKVKSKLETGAMSKTELADKLGITRATLYKRLESGKWKKGELAILNKLL